jgi:hypothetical protein
MGRWTAKHISALAEGYERKLKAPNNTDDPTWLRKRAARLRRAAEKRKKGREYKATIKAKRSAARHRTV